MRLRKIFSYAGIIFLAMMLVSCSTTELKCQSVGISKNLVVSHGRTDTTNDGNVILVGSASSVSISFAGDCLNFQLKSLNPEGKHAFVTLVLNGKDLGRKIVEATATSFTVQAKDSERNILEIYKSTEAANGGVEVMIPNSTKWVHAGSSISSPPIKIEFIGNSITCGYGSDLSIPCGSGEHFDQHNAYWAYGPQLARRLDAAFMLSSVSGIGMYRNWNDEHQLEPIMPEVYENLYLNRDSTKKYDFSFHPDIISICLGTNDLSDGDGKKPRLPFNAEKYISNYVAFIKMLYSHNPQAQIVLLNSPMVTGAKRTVKDSCLNVVKTSFTNDGQHKPILIFHFSSKIIPHGCAGHPNIQEQTQMANEMYPFFKKICNSYGLKHE
jgi:lysophospholipase L1-like esterase